MESLRALTVEVEIETNKRSLTMYMRLGEDETLAEFAERLRAELAAALED